MDREHSNKAPKEKTEENRHNHGSRDGSAEPSLLLHGGPLSGSGNLNGNSKAAEEASLAISLQKFQQKALKQTEQKKSKSAEFLMVKEDEAASAGIENPAFNSSSMDLSAYQTSGGQVIGHDKLYSTLEAHRQNLSLPAHTETGGNEYSRNYFDPLMDEEINPRQSGMEVSGEEIKYTETDQKTRFLTGALNSNFPW
ncbi:orofacial cleft 1 candidate gene 1 protein homolog [Tachyglossus aculeatus]|uniref:orofacial cleft 1 candidate gene 1 protein homolog n=1 Tax=Tachyglossus aculeatus TaxID=9261 RepID=UPI0018F72110|nr:orofacial cleft 1 candidate gene 1 protein homolog [Tachyglossus aculeatus]